MNEVSAETRELVRSELAWIAGLLHSRERLNVPKIRRYLHEMVDRTV